MSNDALAPILAPNLWRAPDWQRLWLSARSNQLEWRSLALVPASKGSSSRTILDIATTMARTGMVHIGQPIHVADATNLTLSQLEPFVEALTSFVSQGDLVLVALGALEENVTTLPLAKAVDAALLCVVSGEMSLAQAKSTISQLGPQRFIGSSFFHPAKKH
jgi:hypothetical protein